MYDNTSRVIEVDIDEILPNRFQPRIQFDEEEILELSDSIKEHGVIQPLVVRTIGDKYEIIAGERRYKASVLAGKETVPVIVKNLNDKDSAEIALIENIQRKNLTPIEEALSYKKILDMGYITQENLASKLGKSQSAVANKIRLLNLSDEVQEALLENKISERHARSLLKLSTSKQQNSMLDRIINERLTVRKADEEIDKIKNNIEEDSEDDNQKIIEKGEIEMNNNMFAMPSASENPQPSPSFDIFGSTTPSTPTVTEVPSAPVENMFAMPSVPTIESTPAVTEIPSAPVENMFAMPSVPTIESTPAVTEMPSAPVDNMFAMPSVPTMESTPAVTEMPSAPVDNMFAMPSVPTMESTPAVTEIPSVPVDNIFAMPSVPTMESTPAVTEIPSVPVDNMFAMPSVPTMENTSTIPEMAPIIDNSNEMTQQSENMFSFGTTTPTSEVAPTQPETVLTPEFKMPEPIIVTDYSKQYDPVMPNIVQPAPQVDFKEVISAIRECSSKIEKFGFKIDVEEYDLANLYQVIFKIEK